MEMTTVKTIGVLSVIFGCFAVLYPKIFHPMIIHAMGSDSDKKTSENHMPPFKHGPGQGQPVNQAGGDDMQRHMRPGPHPGMRAAAEMKKQAASTQGGGGGKGMMGVVLPMYAVGIVIYLIYTMSKVFGKRDKKAGEDYLNTHFADVRYDADHQRSGSSKYGQDDGTGRKSKKSQRDLERLLLKADHNKINESEVEELKRRLMETEQQMSRLLAAMETASTQAEDTLASSEDGEPGQDLPPKEEDSSPDSESCDVSSQPSQDVKFVDGGLPEDIIDGEEDANSPVINLLDATESVEELHANLSSEEIANSAEAASLEEEDLDEGKEVVIGEESTEETHPDLRKRVCQQPEDKQ